MWRCDSGFQVMDFGFLVGRTWILDSTESLAGFRIPWARFRIPKPGILESTNKTFPDSGIRFTLLGAKTISSIFFYNFQVWYSPDWRGKYRLKLTPFKLRKYFSQELISHKNKFSVVSLLPFTVKLRKPWTHEKFQECWLYTDWFLATQEHSINISSVQSFVSFTITNVWILKSGNSQSKVQPW